MSINDPRIMLKDVKITTIVMLLVAVIVMVVDLGPKFCSPQVEESEEATPLGETPE